MPVPTNTPGAPSDFGGLIRNGDFEEALDGKPAHWSKVGGTLELSADSFRGAFSASLESETASLKWIHQVASVEPSGWYRASGRGRVLLGSGEVFFRISWYESGDGSGTSLSQEDGSTLASSAWLALSVGPIQAPADAHSARVRLMVRPAGATLMTGAFDDVLFVEAERPASTPTPTKVAGNTAAPPGGNPTSRTLATVTTRAAQSEGSAPGARTPTPEAFRLISSTGSKAMRISEILSDAVGEGSDSGGEWVELVNAGSEAVDLVGWKIGDARSLDVLPTAIVPPGGFILIAGKTALLPADVVAVRLTAIGGGLNNSGDLVRLLAPDGEEIDTVSFGDNTSVFDPAPPAPPAGATLGARVAGGDPAPENWALTDKPSPGAPNTFPRRAAPGLVGGAVGGVSTEDGASERPTRLIESDEASPVPWIIGTVAICVFAFGIWSSRAKIASTMDKWRR